MSIDQPQHGPPQQGQPQYAQPQYGPPQQALSLYGHPQQPIYSTLQVVEPKGLSLTSMILGIVSFFFGFTFLIPIAGIVLGFIGLRKEPAGKGMAITGLVLSGVMLVGWAILMVMMVVIGLLPLLFLPFAFMGV